MPEPQHNSLALWLNGPRQAQLQPCFVAEPNAHEVQVRTHYSAVSKGTESLVFNGCVPESEYRRMRAPHQEGEFPYPVKYGYINVGQVEKGPPEWLQQYVFCLFPHQSLYNVAIQAVTRLPEHLPPERAVLAANMETAVNVLWDAQPCIGDRITVVGAGVVGLLIAWLAAGIHGCTVQLVDINPQRATIAQALGLAFCLPEAAQAEQDLVIHCSASESGLSLSMTLAALEATVLEVSWFGTQPVNLALGGAFHSRRLQLKATQVGRIAAHQQARWNYSRRLNLALELLKPELDVLITHESSFLTLPDTLATLCHSDDTSLCHRIRYDH